jgi:tetratricopeptide (TPR) repeat protein
MEGDGVSTLPNDRVVSRLAQALIAAGAALVIAIAAGLALRATPSVRSTQPAHAETAAEQPASTNAAAPSPAQRATPAFASAAELQKARESGLHHFELGEDDRALEKLVLVYRAQPQDDAVALAIAEASLRKRDFKTARVLVEALRAPEAPEALRVRGALLEQANRLPEALASYERAIPGLASPYAAMEGRARVLSWMERFDDGIAAYRVLADDARAGIELQRRSRVRIAELTAWKKDLDGALAQLAILLAEQPRSAEALLLQGQILEWQGKYAEAKRSYSTVLAFDAAHAQARMRLDKLLWVE